MFCIVFDLSMAVITFLMGYLFYRSNGKGANFLAGYNTKTKAERAQYDEAAMCRLYGKRMMQMALPFVLGAALDLYKEGVGCILAWIVWLIMLILLMKKRSQVEK